VWGVGWGVGWGAVRGDRSGWYYRGTCNQDHNQNHNHTHTHNQVLQGATLSEVQSLFDEHLWPLSPKRRKLSVRVLPLKGAASAAAAAAPADGVPATAAAAGGAGGKPRSPRKAAHAHAHVQHAHPHHGTHVLPPLGGSPTKGGAAMASGMQTRSRMGAATAGGVNGAAAGGKPQRPAQKQQQQQQHDGGKERAAAVADDPAAAPVPVLPVPEKAIPDLDALKRSLRTYPASLSMYPQPVALQQ